MRIIAGDYKSRILKTPPSLKVRPTTDRARETLFNILSNEINFEGLTCLDLFCGTGSFGLECLSRGADKCIFVDKDISTVNANINSLGVSMQAETVKSDAVFFLNQNNHLKPKITFADPPYAFEKYGELIGKVKALGGIFILEHSVKAQIPRDYNGLLTREKKIGISSFSFFDFNQN